MAITWSNTTNSCYYIPDSQTATWETWTTSTIESNTTTTTDTIYVWKTWVQEGTWDVSTDRPFQEVWTKWVHVGFTPSREETEAFRKKCEEEAKKEENKENVALALLEELIGREKTEKYKKTGRLLFKGKTGTFILDKGGDHKFIKDNKITNLCIHLKDNWVYPKTDNIIALKTLLESDEKEFYKTANKHRTSEAPLQLPECAILQ